MTASAITSNDITTVWLEIIFMLVAIIVLVLGVIYFVAKRKNIATISAISTFVLGALTVYIPMGLLIVLSGILGILGAKEGLNDDRRLKQEPMAYIMGVFTAIVVIASVLIKNGETILHMNEDANKTAKRNYTSSF